MSVDGKLASSAAACVYREGDDKVYYHFYEQYYCSALKSSGWTRRNHYQVQSSFWLNGKMMVDKDNADLCARGTTLEETCGEAI